MRVLTLDGASGLASVGLVQGEDLAAELRCEVNELAANVAQLLEAHGRDLDLISACVGPGSFTGLRAALSLAEGLGLARAVPVVGVTVGMALSDPALAGRALWTAIDTKRGRVCLERGESAATYALADLPRPVCPIAVAGDAAVAVAARLAARGADVQLLDARRPDPLGIARAAREGRTRPALPLYVDPPEARPGASVRPPPA